jgi:hypothetical protein
MPREKRSKSDSKPVKRPKSRIKELLTKRANPAKQAKRARPSSRPKGKTLLQQIFGLLAGLFVLFSVIATAATALYLANLTEGINKRFAGRLWDIPSKIYSDITLLYPGQAINRSLLLAKEID